MRVLRFWFLLTHYLNAAIVGVRHSILQLKNTSANVLAEPENLKLFNIKFSEGVKTPRMRYESDIKKK